MTNATNVHTCSIGGVDLVIPPILVMERQLLELIRDVISRYGISVPVGVDSIGRVASYSCILFIRYIIFIKAMPTFHYHMTSLATKLT
jgi:hypothetical protein